MPYRRKTKTKRKYKKKSSNFNKQTGSGLSPSLPLGKHFKFNARYVETSVSLDPGVGGIPVSYVFSLNGLYDPNITGIGHQPLGFDQLMTMYDHYTVIGARARVNFINNDDTTAQTVVLQIKDTASTSADLSNVIENGMNRYTLLGKSGSGSSNKTLTMNFSTSKFFTKKALIGDDEYRGTVAANPKEQAYLHVMVAPITGADVLDVRFNIEIDYIAILSEPKQLGSS